VQIFTVAFWHDSAERAIRSFAQGFLVGAGLGSYAGDFATLSLQACAHGLAAGASMALLSVLMRLAYPPEDT
jgi:hypothetical protein